MLVWGHSERFLNTYDLIPTDGLIEDSGCEGYLGVKSWSGVDLEAVVAAHPGPGMRLKIDSGSQTFFRGRPWHIVRAWLSTGDSPHQVGESKN